MRLLPLLLLAALAAAQDTDHEDKADKEGKKGDQGFRFVWKKHPSIRLGDWFRADFRARLQFDWEVRDPEVKGTPDLFNIPRKRLAVEGTAFKYFEYEVSRELSDVDFPWKDVYGNFRYFRKFQVRGGRFRIPFSLDQLTGPTNLDFIDRSRAADRLAPNRDTGVMLHGSFFDQGFKYQFGYFFNDGDNGSDRDNRRTGERTWAGRATSQPLRFLPHMKHLTLGFAMNAAEVPEGLFGLRGRTVSRETFYPHYWVKGQRRRSGLELSWTEGPFSVKSEFIDVREQRQQQSLAGTDLPDLLHRGWYLHGTWAVTGQNKEKGLARGRYVPIIGGWGALELAARYEALRFGSATGEGRPSRSTRAANVLQTSDRVWTFGINWYVNQWTKIQANFIRDTIEDPFRFAIPGQRNFWTYKIRLQQDL